MQLTSEHKDWTSDAYQWTRRKHGPDRRGANGCRRRLPPGVRLRRAGNSDAALICETCCITHAVGLGGFLPDFYAIRKTVVWSGTVAHIFAQQYVQFGDVELLFLTQPAHVLTARLLREL